jgi:hypothetical protein
MKYLKLFESNSYFTEISEQEFDRLYDGVFTEIDPYEISKIEKTISYTYDKELVLHRMGVGAYRVVFRSNGMWFREVRKNMSMNIYQLSDEWYYMWLHGDDDSGDDDIYYRCDQFEGLIKCIEFQ